MEIVHVNAGTGETVAAEATADELAEIATADSSASEFTQAEGKTVDLRERASAAIAQLEKGVDAIENGTLFRDATAAEKTYLRLLGRSLADLARLELRELGGDA